MTMHIDPCFYLPHMFLQERYVCYRTVPDQHLLDYYTRSGGDMVRLHSPAAELLFKSR